MPPDGAAGMTAEDECPTQAPVVGSACERRMGPAGRCRYDELECECAMDMWRCRERPEPPGPPGAGGAPDGPPDGPGGPPGGAGAPDGPGM